MATSREHPAFEGVLLAPATTSGRRSQGWVDGPLPLGLRNGMQADAAARATYFEPRACRTLYGGEASSRWHRRLDDPVPLTGALEVTALELVVPDLRAGDAAWLLLHWRASRDPVDDLHTVSRLRPAADASLPLEGFVRAHVPQVAALGEQLPRAFCLTLQRGARPGAAAGASGVAGAWDERRRLFVLASATPTHRYPLTDPVLAGLEEFHLELSADWSALVLRDGIGFLARPGSNDRFVDDAAVYVRTIYADAALMGLFQLTALHALADRLRAMADPTADLDRLLDLERSFSLFRNELWWQHLSKHGVANQLLQRLAGQHRLPALLDQIVEELRDYARQAQLRRSAAERERERREAEREARLNLAISAIGVIAVPPTLASALVDVLPDGWAGTRPLAAGVWVTTTVVAAVLAWWFLRRQRHDDGSSDEPG